MNKQEKEVLEKAGVSYKPLSDKISLTIINPTEYDTELAMTLNMEVKTRVCNLPAMSPSEQITYYALYVEHLLGMIEKSLYDMLPSLNIQLPVSPHEDDPRIRIDSHIPDDVILMSPSTYTSLHRKEPEYLHSSFSRICCP